MWIVAAYWQTHSPSCLAWSGLAAIWRWVCIHQVNRRNSCNGSKPWRQHHKYCHVYYYYTINRILLQTSIPSTEDSPRSDIMQLRNGHVLKVDVNTTFWVFYHWITHLPVTDMLTCHHCGNTGDTNAIVNAVDMNISKHTHILTNNNTHPTSHFYSHYASPPVLVAIKELQKFLKRFMKIKLFRVRGNIRVYASGYHPCVVRNANSRTVHVYFSCTTN